MRILEEFWYGNIEPTEYGTSACEEYKKLLELICRNEEKLNDIPSADGNLDDINRPKRTTLKNAYDDNLLFTFKTCHINPDLVKATKMNMVMNNDGSGNILQSNSLLPPHEWTEDFRSNLAEALGIDKSTIRNHKTIEFFNVIVTNPPFGSKIPIKDKAILEQFELAHVWENDKKTNTWKMTDRLQSSVPPEILFVERCTQLLVPGGRMGIVLPDNILGAPGLGYIREWLIKNHRIVASVDLHVDTFQPRNGTQTSVLFLQKKTQEQKDTEEKSGTMADYNIFMAMVEKVGHDKRGKRLEASVYDVEAKQAREIIADAKYPLTTLGGADGMTTSYTGARFKRIWVEKSDYPIYQPSTIMDIKPSPDGYISAVTDTDIDALRVSKGQVLMTCSGTIGKVSFVSDTIDNLIFSHDLLRINCKKPSDAGYVYAYLKSKVGIHSFSS